MNALLNSLIEDRFSTVEDFGKAAFQLSKSDNGSDEFNKVKTHFSRKYLIVKNMVKNGLPLSTPYNAVREVVELAAQQKKIITEASRQNNKSSDDIASYE